MKKIFGFILLLWASLPLQAQQAPDELKSLINQSFGYFPRFKELQQTVATGEQQVALAATGNKPIVSGVASYSYIDPVAEAVFPVGGEAKVLQFQPHHNFNTGISIVQPLYDFGKTKLAVERARQALQQSKNNIEAGKAQLAAQVANIYYTIIYLKDAIAVQDSAISVLAANKRLMESRFKNGDALKIDVLTLQNNIDLEQNRKTDLQTNLEKQQSLLAYATGNTGNDLKDTAFRFAATPATAAEALKAAQAGNYDYIIAQQRIRLAETERAITRLDSRPTINLNGSTGFRNGYQPNISAVRFNYAAGVGINVPIFNGGRIRKQEQIAESGVKQQELALATLDNQYEKDVQQALTDIHANEERLRTTNEQIAIAREALRLAQSRYNNGISTQIELLNANTNLQRTELAALQYQYQSTLAHVELARLMGMKYW